MAELFRFGVVLFQFFLLPLWEKVAAQRPDEGFSRESRRFTPLEHPSSVSALRADPPSPARGEGEVAALAAPSRIV
ncbi:MULTISPECIES: hypothetical protein [unclassified Mesorhizobium]|uniref:hypothetical protein n=1 Tax=unclassified Mesorhizobium TaxID=325217 RepID=UPI000F755CE3|nr:MULTISPECIES: hypothetical protein [unclassified Mesorhizobium]AZO71393.1 hypothetical protein EJ067_09585 [Mesorhizobium sp. M1D.F.Ca.ET.043.01.1.1]